jgi:phage-related protein
MFTSLLAPTDEAKSAIADLSQRVGMGSNAFIDANGKMKDMAEIQRILHDSTEGLSDAKKAEAMHTIFGQYAMQGMIEVASKTPAEFKKMSDAINQTGTAQAKASDWIKTGSGQWQQFTENVDQAKKKLGDGLLPTIKEALSSVLTPLSNWFVNLSPATQKVIAYAIAFTAAVVGIVGVVGGAIAAFGMMQIGLALAGTSLGALVAAAAPVIAIIAGIIAIGVALYAAYQTNFGGLRDAMNAIWTEITKTFGEAYKAIKAWLDDIAPTAQKAWTNFKAIMEPLVRFLIDILGPAIANGWEAIKKIFAGAMEIIGGSIKFWLALFAGDWGKAWEGVKGVLKGAWDVIVGLVESGLGGILAIFGLRITDVMAKLDGWWTAIKTWFTNLATNMGDWASNAIDMFVKGIESGVSAVGDAISKVADKVKNFLGFHSPTKEGPASDSDTWMPNMIGMFVDGIGAHRPRLQSAVNALALDMSVGLNGGVAAPSLTARSGGVTNHITINYQASGKGDDVERLAQAVRRAVSVVTA